MLPTLPIHRIARKRWKRLQTGWQSVYKRNGSHSCKWLGADRASFAHPDRPGIAGLDYPRTGADQPGTVPRRYLGHQDNQP